MRVLITGATSGIGKQLVHDYLAEGHHVIACGRNEQKLKQLENEVNQGALTTIQFDVTDREEVMSALSSVNESIDVVILNAGVCEYIDDAQQLDSRLVERVFAANFFGVVYCVEALLPRLKQGAKLAVVESLARLMPFSRAQAYGSSKAAIYYFMQGLKVDLQETGIDVITIAPGFVKTPLTDKNDFEMPMRIPVADASNAIRKGIRKGKNQIYFPLVFSWVLRLLHKLPASLQVRLSRRMKRASDENSSSG